MNDHLASCSWCRRELAGYDALDAAARQHLTGVGFTPLTLEDIVHASETPADARVAATAGASRKTGPVLRSLPPLSTLGPLAAVVVLVLFAGLIFAAHNSALGATSGGSPTPLAQTQAAKLTQTTWTLTRLVVDGREQQLVPGRAPTLHLGPHDGQFYGVGGCNSYGGKYMLAGDTLQLSSFYFTLARCLPAAVMDQEDAYFQALPRVKRYHVNGNTLTLTSVDGKVQLTFQAG